MTVAVLSHRVRARPSNPSRHPDNMPISEYENARGTQKFVMAATQMKRPADRSRERTLIVATHGRAIRRAVPARYRTSKSSGVARTMQQTTTSAMRSGMNGTGELTLKEVPTHCCSGGL